MTLNLRVDGVQGSLNPTGWLEFDAISTGVENFKWVFKMWNHSQAEVEYVEMLLFYIFCAVPVDIFPD